MSVRPLAARLVALIALAALPLHAQQLYQNLGDHRYAVTTKNPEAQRYFDQGLRLTWAFNHPEAVRSFAEGERIDSSCAMCAWGIAYASGPNINLGMDAEAGKQAYAAITRAHRLRRPAWCGPSN